MPRKVIGWLVILSLGWGSGEIYYLNHGKKVVLTPLETTQLRQKGQEERLFLDSRGGTLKIGQRVIVQAAPGTDLAAYAKTYGLTSVKKLGQGLYLLRADSVENAIEAANRLAKESGILFAQPDVARKRSLR